MVLDKAESMRRCFCPFRFRDRRLFFEFLETFKEGRRALAAVFFLVDVMTVLERFASSVVCGVCCTLRLDGVDFSTIDGVFGGKRVFPRRDLAWELTDGCSLACFLALSICWNIWGMRKFFLKQNSNFFYLKVNVLNHLKFRYIWYFSAQCKTE